MLVFQGGSVRLGLPGSALACFWEVLGLPSSAHHPGGHTHRLTVTTQRGQGWDRGAQGPRQPERCLTQPGCQVRLPKGGDIRAI